MIRWRRRAFCRSALAWATLNAGAALAIDAPPAASGAAAAAKPGPGDLCPVCGMLVAKYPAWLASVTYRDGRSQFFDGAKDLFKYLLQHDRYAPGRRREDIVAALVTEYYGLARIDAGAAHYVVGSDVLGPMGHELVALAGAAEAAEFMRDHRGVRVLRLAEIDAGWVDRVDRGL